MPIFDQHRKAPVSIKINGVCKAFGERIVLNQLNLEVNPGEIFVLMGPSGVGKSVFLKLLAGLDRPDAGHITINRTSLDRVKKTNKYVLGLVFQAGALFNSISVFDNLALYFREHALYDEAEIEKRIFQVLHMLNLQNTAFLMPSNLSGGMKKRVALARGLLMEPDVLLFDEPTSELDPMTAASIIELIGFVNKNLGMTTVIVSHDIILAKNIGTHIGVIQNGKIDEVYTAQTIMCAKNEYVKNFLNPTINLEHPNFLSLLS